MEKKQYITVAEFAKLVGISRQAVYSRLDSKEFTKYVKIDNKGKKPRKLINTEALKLFQQKEVNQVDSQIDNEFDKNDNVLDSLIEALKDELKQKDKVIEAQQKQIEELTRLLDQQQQLQAMLSKQLALNEQKAEEAGPEPEGTVKRGFFSRIFNR